MTPPSKKNSPQPIRESATDFSSWDTVSIPTHEDIIASIKNQPPMTPEQFYAQTRWMLELENADYEKRLERKLRFFEKHGVEM
jgi:hypothetical protein